MSSGFVVEVQTRHLFFFENSSPSSEASLQRARSHHASSFRRSRGLRFPRSRLAHANAPRASQLAVRSLEGGSNRTQAVGTACWHTPTIARGLRAVALTVRRSWSVAAPSLPRTLTRVVSPRVPRAASNAPRAFASSASSRHPSTVAMASTARDFQVVVAATKDEMGIGLDGQLPWRLPKDMAYFKSLTAQTDEPGLRNAVVMGRKTRSPSPSSSAPGRLNGVAVGRDAEAWATRTPRPRTARKWRCFPRACFCARAWTTRFRRSPLTRREERTSSASSSSAAGGCTPSAAAAPRCSAVHLTEVTPPPSAPDAFKCDTFLPKLEPARFKLYAAAPVVREKDGATIQFLTYFAADPATGKVGRSGRRRCRRRRAPRAWRTPRRSTWT